jgi:DNA-directed RNA polymerase specialized sigma24 family protein
MAVNLLRRWFRGIDEEEALQEACIACLHGVTKFEAGRGRAFNYLTSCSLNAFRKLYRQDKTYRDLIARCKERLM